MKYVDNLPEEAYIPTKLQRGSTGRYTKNHLYKLKQNTTINQKNKTLCGMELMLFTVGSGFCKKCDKVFDERNKNEKQD